MSLFVLMIVVYLGVLREEVKRDQWFSNCPVNLKSTRKYFKNWLEKIITGNMEKIIPYYIHCNWCQWRFHVK